MSKKPHTTSQDGISRRRFPGWSTGTLAVTAAASIAGIAPAHAKKVAKGAVMYQDSPRDPRKCDGCKFFLADTKACERVEGEISADGWCAIWRKK